MVWRSPIEIARRPCRSGSQSGAKRLGRLSELFGTKPTGRSFRAMSIDVFTVKGGKLASAYHVENWIGALEQIGK